MDFIVQALSADPNTMIVRYDCACGCKPHAEYEKGSDEVGHEHCCCGRVHFVGKTAHASLEEYLAERKAAGEPDDVARGGYDLHDTTVAAPWGETVPVTYGLPRTFLKH